MVQKNLLWVGEQRLLVVMGLILIPTYLHAEASSPEAWVDIWWHLFLFTASQSASGLEADMASSLIHAVFSPHMLPSHMQYHVSVCIDLNISKAPIAFLLPQVSIWAPASGHLGTEPKANRGTK